MGALGWIIWYSTELLVSGSSVYAPHWAWSPLKKQTKQTNKWMNELLNRNMTYDSRNGSQMHIYCIWHSEQGNSMGTRTGNWFPGTGSGGWIQKGNQRELLRWQIYCVSWPCCWEQESVIFPIPVKFYTTEWMSLGIIF